MLYNTKNPHGGDIYADEIIMDFSANTNPYGTSPKVLRAMEEILPRVHFYPDPYCRELVQAIAEFEKLPREYILCGNGASELIYSYCQALKPRIAVELAPTFSEYTLALEQVGGKMLRYEVHQADSFDLDARFLSYLEETKPEIVFLCNPNNPTGRLISETLLKEILFLCRAHNMRLFLDECFLDLSDDGFSMKEYLEDYPELFILKAFTKSYGMAGVRLGYGLCADAELLVQMSKTVQAWNVSMLAQAAGVAALQDGEFLAKTRTLVPVEREWLSRQLEELGFWVCPSEVNYILFRGEGNLDKEMKKHGIMIRNCSNFHGLSSGWYRIAVRLPEQNKHLISAMKQIIGKE